MSALRCRPVALLMLVAFMGACTTWQPTTVSPRQVIEEEEPASVRITRGDGTELTLNDPFIRNDSVGAVQEVCETSAVGGGRFNCLEMSTTVLPVNDVMELEVRTPSAGGTAVALLVGAVVVGAVGFLAYWESEVSGR